MKSISSFNPIKFLIFFFISIGYSQVYDASFDPTAEANRIISTPNTPEAQAFEKYGSTPVNLYTGTPNIQVPIYTFKGRELDLPINLTYDASGIKVEQLATSVGLGWNLNVGGRISRITNGLPDDFHPYGWTTAHYMSIWDSTVRNGIQTYAALPSNPLFSTHQELINYLYFIQKADRNEYDTQPDYFSFSALGISDTFTIDINSLQPKSLDNPRLKVQLTKAPGGANTPITAWEVTSDSGVVFTFEEQEITRSTNHDTYGPQSLYGFKKEYTSSWLLTKIESPNGKDIYDFSYYNNFGFWASNRQASSLNGVTNVIAVNSGQPPTVPTPTNPIAFSTKDYSIDQKVLKEIHHNGRLILGIDLLPNRHDMSINNAIEFIHIYDQDTGSHSADLHKSFKLNYDYFRTSTVTPPVNQSTNELLIRLKLDEVEIRDKNEQTVKSFSFDYFDPYVMPSTTSKGQDYYGYNNGASSNSVLYPKYTHPYILSNDGANRDVSFTQARKGLLNKISYPTGGHTIFEYEPNYEQEITGTSTNWNTIVSVTLSNPTLPPFDINACNATLQSGSVTPATSSSVFEIFSDNTEIRTTYDQQGNIGKVFTIERVATIVKINDPNSTLLWTDVYDNNCNIKPGVDVVWSKTVIDDIGLNPIYPQIDDDISLDSGYYQVILANPSSSFINSIVVDEAETITNYNYNEKAGIRIKEIKDYSDPSTLAFHRTYDYPSGTVISDPKYTFQSTQYSMDSNNSPVESTILHRIAYASGTDNPHIGYTKVIETVVDVMGTDENGYTEHEFYTTTAGNYKSGVYTYFINGKETSNQYGVSYELGKSKGTKVYDTNNELLTSQSHIYYDIEYYSNTGIYLHMDDSKSELFPIPTQEPGGDWFISYLPYKALTAYAGGVLGPGLNGVGLAPPDECIDLQRWVNTSYANDLCKPNIARLIKRTTKAWGKHGGLTQSISKQYYNSGDDIHQQISDYSYYDQGESENYLPKETSSTNSKGETFKQEFKYPHSFQSEYYQLKSANMISSPVQTTTFKNMTKISDKRTYFNAKLPDSVAFAKGNETLQTRIIFERFEDNNLVQIRQPHGSPTAYIWGYDNRYVVAKVQNITFAEIENLSSFGTGFSLGNSGLSSAQKNELLGLTAAMVTFYDHDPLVGVVKITDSRGRETNYSYDDFHRLEMVKDHDLNILSKTQYNFKQ